MNTMHIRTLKEMCCQNIVKYGVAWEDQDLPDTVVKEIENLELRLIYAFNGRFSIVEDYAGSELAISWRAGEWHFNMLNVGTIRIKGGVHNDLGKLGGALFLFPQREVNISDFHMDMDSRELRFVGMCSSAKDVAGRNLVSTLQFSKFRQFMTMTTMLTSLNGVEVKKKERIFVELNSYRSSYWIVNRGLDSGSDESDSSIEY